MVTRAIKTGDRVLVAWGLTEIEGVVVETYRSASPALGQRVVVRVEGVDDGDDSTVAVPSSAVRLLTAA